VSGVLDVIVVLVLGAFVGFAGATWRGLRTLRRQRDELAQARLALRREVARNATLRHDADAAQRSAALWQAQVVALMYAREDSSKASEDVAGRFCWN
jgi:hypothetical protein